MEDGEYSTFVEGSEIDVLKNFAGFGCPDGTKLRKRFLLAQKYEDEDLTDPDKWSHKSGEGWIFDPEDNGKIRRAEVHWVEYEGEIMKEFVFKRWVR